MSPLGTLNRKQFYYSTFPHCILLCCIESSFSGHVTCLRQLCFSGPFSELVLMLAGKAGVLFGVLCPFCFQCCVSSVPGAVFLTFFTFVTKIPDKPLTKGRPCGPWQAWGGVGWGDSVSGGSVRHVASTARKERELCAGVPFTFFLQSHSGP